MSDVEIVGKITLLFAGWGAIAGFISGFLRGMPTEQGGLALLAIFLFLFYVSYKLAPRALKIPIQEFPGGKWTGWVAFKKGFLTFFIMWLVLWIMVYTISVS